MVFRSNIRPLRQLAAVIAVLAGTACAAQPLALDEALRIAEKRSPQLAAQRASAEAFAALVPAASELPDPKLVFGVENVPTEGGDRWSITADSMTMRRVGVMQDFVRGEKREARGAKAVAESEREAAMLEMQRADLHRDVAIAWLERHYAQRSQGLVKGLMNEAELQASTSTAELAAGRAASTEPIAARALRATLADRLQDLERQERKAAVMLARWVGEAADRAAGEAPDVTRLPREIRALEVDVERHPQLAQYAPMEAAAEAELRLAAAATKPDFSVELSYGMRGSAYIEMVSLMVRMELPLFASRRQDPVTNARRRQVDQVRAQAEDARQRHVAEIRSAFVDWEVGKERLARHQKEIVPLAEDRARAALAAYEGARLDLAMLLEARRGVLEARLAAIAAEAELARAWAQLAYLLPERNTP